MVETEKPETADLTTDEALLSSLGEHKVDDLKLEPYSLLRQTIASDLCDSARGTFFNAIMTCWVCTLKPKEALEAHVDLVAAKEKAFEWAESKGYNLWNWRPVVEAYNRMQNEWYATAKAHVKSSGNGETPDPNSGGQAA